MSNTIIRDGMIEKGTMEPPWAYEIRSANQERDKAKAEVSRLNGERYRLMNEVTDLRASEARAKADLRDAIRKHEREQADLKNRLLEVQRRADYLQRRIDDARFQDDECDEDEDGGESIAGRTIDLSGIEGRIRNITITANGYRLEIEP